MFRTTRELLNKNWNDIKFLYKLPGIMQPYIFLFAIIYQLYMIFADSDLTYLHLTLLVLLIGNFAFRILIKNSYDDAIIDSKLSKRELKERKRSLKEAMKTEDLIYKIVTMSIRAVVIGVSIYSIIIEASAIKIIATIIIATEFIVELLLYTLIRIIASRFYALKNAFFEDLTAITETVTVPIQKATEAVKSTVKSALGIFSRFRKGSSPTQLDTEDTTETV